MVTEQATGWYYVDAERQSRGPLPLGELKALAERGVIRFETPVWTEGYASWVRASEVGGLVAPPAAASSAVPPALPAASGGSPPAQQLRPRIGSFIFRRVVTGVILFAILSVGVCGVLALSGKAPAMGLLVLALGVAVTVCAALVAYRKERYELLEGTVVCHRGGLMSDQKTELEIRNITHVKVRLPWMRYKLFGVGNVIIESAGNAQPVVLRDVRGPEDVYAGMRERMKHNGYGLTQQQLLHEEGPAIIGVILDCLRMAAVGLVVILFILPTLIPIAGANDYPVATAVLSFLSIAAIVGVVAAIVVRFLDLRRRTYRVYNDVVVYEEGFLTRNNAFIPAENLADAATTRSLRDKFLNLYDVVISCQGSTSAIKFRRLRHGEQLSRCIDQLVLEAGRKTAPAGTRSARKAPTAAASIPQRAEPDLVAPGEAWVADLKMSPARVFVPLLLLLPLLPLWIIAMIQAAIRLMSTNYAVRPGSIRHSYRFLTTHDREFAYDKITGLVIKKDLWDRLCGTVTLRFWSIGSGQSLVLAHVLRKDVDIDAIKRQIGIPAASAHPCEVPAAFGVFAWLRSRCLRLVFGLVAAIGFAVAAMQFGENLLYLPAAAVAVTCLAGFGYARAFYSRQRLRFHDHHVEAEQGVITRRRYLARYHNVKKTLVTRYPGGREGSLQIFVAGEQLVSAGRSGKMRVPCAFTLGVLPDAMEQGQLLDDILCGRVDPASGSTPADPLDPLYEASRSAGNTLFKLILASVLIVPLVVLLPLTIPIVVLVVKRWRYRLEAGRVATSWGLLFRKQASIILDRVDSLQQQQGPLNKLFRNGNVSIMTAGSSQPDLVMPNAPDFETLYQETRARSQGGEGH